MHGMLYSIRVSSGVSCARSSPSAQVQGADASGDVGISQTVITPSPGVVGATS